MKEEVRRNVVLAPYTTFGIGGNAEYFASAENAEELAGLIEYANKNNLAVTILGGGSNALISDEGVKGLVVKMEMSGIEYEPAGADGDVFVTAGAGVSWDELVKDTVAKNFWGLENLSGIPGTVGGAVVQNINAYGVTVADLVELVEAFHLRTGTSRRFTSSECEFEYRNSFFKREGVGKEYVITKVRLRLSAVKKLQAEYRSSSQSIDAYLKEKDITEPSAADMREAILHIRSKIGMLEGMYKSAGSFFKNPIMSKEDFAKVIEIVNKEHGDIAAKLTPWHWSVGEDKEKVSAAFLMECTPYNKTAFADKSYNNSVGISPVHTLSIINLGNAKASDVKKFAKKIFDTIEKKFGIKFESEVCVL